MSLLKYILKESLRNKNWYCRFIHDNLEKNQLPKHWYYPPNNIFDGAQVLSVSKALHMAVTKEDNRDDWFHFDSYTYLAFLNVSGLSGESRLGYRAILENDLKDMYVIELSEVSGAILEIALKMEEENYPIIIGEYGLEEDWDNDLDTDDYNEFIDRLLNRYAKKVNPEFIETV